MTFSWYQVVKQLLPKQRAIEGIPRGLDKKNWLNLIAQRKARQSDQRVLSPRYPYTAIPVQVETLGNYVGGGLDPIYDGEDG